MIRSPKWFRLSLVLVASIALGGTLRADDAADKSADKPEQEATTSTAKAEPAKATPAAKPQSKPKYPPFDTVVKDAKKYSGLLTLYQKDQKLYAELRSSDLNKDFILLLSIAKGIGQRPLLGGMTWGFGDDWVWQFRKIGDRIQVVRRNLRFRAKAGSPAEKAVKLAYTDSVLFSLPVVTKSPSGADVVDLTSVFMSDLPQISMVLRGFSFSASKSSWAAIKAYKDNVELQVAATYASSGTQDIESVADSRGVTINVHYSLSALPKNGYKPRLADDRIGYFMTVVKDYSKKERDRFVRYINRWDLQKADSSAELSPPKKPIIFWLEKTIPYKYRKPIREGILEWNKAFEAAGFLNAVEVRQQPDNAEWDPEDINYNTFRWITSSAGFAMGPSRVNPSTGQILDADIIFDADFLNFWKEEYETFTPKGIEALTGGPVTLEGYREQLRNLPPHDHTAHRHCRCAEGAAMQLAFGATVMATRTQSPEDLEKLIMQALKEVTMHEVGHTLGLRHNFKASGYYSLKDLNDPKKTRATGITASVMDYSPANIVPKDTKQGDYYSTTIGPYDVWAIEYGYKHFSGSEEAELKKIAARSGEPALDYATDEDTRGIDPDPASNRFDLGKDSVAYARQQAKLVAEALPGVVDRLTEEGEGYQQPRRAFGVLLGTYGRAMFVAARNVGGLYTSRSHKGDAKARPPFEVVPAEQQRKALELLEQQVFNDEPFEFPAELYNHLAPSRWNHWGSRLLDRSDYPVHMVISLWQNRILEQLLSPLTLERLYDSEVKVPAGEDALTTAELLQRLTKAIYSEVDTLKAGEYTVREPAVSSIRRNLQRSYFKRLAALALGYNSAPQDCQTVAYAELVALEARIQKLLKRKIKLDTYTRAHLQETASRAKKVVEARLTLHAP